MNESQARQAKTDEELIEELAAVQHAIWAHWMRYMFTCGQFGADGTWHMPAFKAERWQRQMDTPYSELTEREKDSDRSQAHKVLAVLGAPSQTVDFPLEDLRTILDAMLEWSQPPMREYDAAVRVDGLLRQLETQTEGAAA